MRPLLTAAVLMLVVGLPTTAGTQHRGDRHGDNHQGSNADGRPTVVVEQPVVRSTVVKPGVVGPSVVVKQPVVAGWPTPGTPARPGFGSMPVRTGFGSASVRTGFGTAPVETSLSDQVDRPRVDSTRPSRWSKGFRGSKAHHGIAVIFVPVPYPYGHELPFGFTASGSSHLSPFEGQRGANNRVGITVGLSTYWMDLSNQAGASAGLAFDVSPAPTEVYVDNVYAGVVQDFATGRQPLMVVPGTHRIELRTPGYQPVLFDVTIAPGQVIPFTGELNSLRPN